MMSWEYVTKKYLLEGVDPETAEWDKILLKKIMDKINIFIEPMIERINTMNLKDFKIRGFRLKFIKKVLEYIYHSDAFYTCPALKYKVKNNKIICD